MAGLFQGAVGEVGPARPLPFGWVRDPVALAVDRVEFDRLATQLALVGNVARRKHDVRVPVAVMPAQFAVGFVVLAGIPLQFGVADEAGACKATSAATP